MEIITQLMRILVVPLLSAAEPILLPICGILLVYLVIAIRRWRAGQTSNQGHIAIIFASLIVVATLKVILPELKRIGEGRPLF